MNFRSRQRSIYIDILEKIMVIILEQYNCWQVTTSTYIYTFWNFISEFGGWFGLFLGEESISLSTVQYALNHYYAKIQVHHNSS